MTSSRLSNASAALIAPLAPLPRLLADEPAIRAVIARAEVVSIPDAARAIAIAAIAGITTRRPVLVAVPTRDEADRIAHDLGAFLPSHDVELFPAWETLPFERVSPALETMGRRLRVLWRPVSYTHLTLPTTPYV